MYVPFAVTSFVVLVPQFVPSHEYGFSSNPEPPSLSVAVIVNVTLSFVQFIVFDVTFIVGAVLSILLIVILFSTIVPALFFTYTLYVPFTITSFVVLVPQFVPSHEYGLSSSPELPCALFTDIVNVTLSFVQFVVLGVIFTVGNVLSILFTVILLFATFPALSLT